MKKIISISAMVMLFCVSLLISNRFGYRRGFADRVLYGIPGDLIVQLQMYSVSTNFPDNVLPSLLKEGSVKLHLYGTLHTLDQHYDRVTRLQEQRLGDWFCRESFERNVKRAQNIIEDFEVMTLREALEPLMDNDGKGVKDDGFRR